MSQLWSNAKPPEVRDIRRYRGDASVGLRRTDSDEARVFLQDVAGILQKHKTVQLGAGDMFGEIATIARMPRTTSVFAEAGAELLEFMRLAVSEFGQTIVMVTHDPIAASYSDRIVFLEDGRVVDEMADPTAERILDRMKLLGV